MTDALYFMIPDLINETIGETKTIGTSAESLDGIYVMGIGLDNSN